VNGGVKGGCEGRAADLGRVSKGRREGGLEEVGGGVIMIEASELGQVRRVGVKGEGRS
jgi:hypothetical protein